MIVRIQKYLRIKFLVSIVILLMAPNLYSQIQYFESKLPLIIIDTNGNQIVDEPKIIADMGIIYNGYNEVNKTTDPFNHYEGKVGIEIRGNTSQLFPKKSYAFETRDPSSPQNDKDETLLGLPEEEDWVLYGPYADKTLIRNALAYHLSRKMGHYAPRTKFCELIINNEYKGLYILIEKIKRDNNRVNISKLKDTDNSGDELTGGYVFKKDQIAGSQTEGWWSMYPPDFMTGAGLFYQYHSPSQTKITEEQKQYIHDWMDNFENVMNANYKYDPVLGYYQFVDMNDIVDFLIISEACKNYDTCFSSFFMYKDKDSKDPTLHFGPIWDYNISMGNSEYQVTASPQGWIMDLTHNPWGTPFGRPFWTQVIWDDTIFQTQFRYRMRLLRGGYLSYASVNGTINQMVGQISDALERNFTKWPISGTHEQKIDDLKDWWSDRFSWIDSIVGQPISNDTTKPAIPTNFIASSQQGYIELSWSPNSEDDIWSYSIFKGTEAGGGFMNLLNTVLHPNTTFIDSLIDANTTYFYQISAMDTKNNQSDRSQQITTTTLSVLEDKNINFFKLAQNYPNPFNSHTSIKYTVPNESNISIAIYDLMGNKLLSLNRENEHPGPHTYSWNGKDSFNNEVESGIYFYTIKVGKNSKTKKMVLLK